jgi:hypothetical protein
VFVNDINVPGGNKITVPDSSAHPEPISPQDRRNLGRDLAFRGGMGTAAAAPEPFQNAENRGGGGSLPNLHDNSNSTPQLVASATLNVSEELDGSTSSGPESGSSIPSGLESGSSISSGLESGSFISSGPESGSSIPSGPESSSSIPSVPESSSSIPSVPESSSSIPSMPESSSSIPSMPESGSSIPSMPELGSSIPSGPELGNSLNTGTSQLATVATVAGTIGPSTGTSVDNNTTGTFGFTVQLQGGEITDAYIKMSGTSWNAYSVRAAYDQSLHPTTLDFYGGEGKADADGYSINGFLNGPGTDDSWRALRGRGDSMARGSSLFYDGSEGNLDAFKKADTIPANYIIQHSGGEGTLDAGVGTGTVTRH